MDTYVFFKEIRMTDQQKIRPLIQEAIYSVQADSIGDALNVIGYGGYAYLFKEHQYWMTHTYNENFDTWDISIKHSSWLMDTEECEEFMKGEKAYALGCRR